LQKNGENSAGFGSSGSVHEKLVYFLNCCILITLFPCGKCIHIFWLVCYGAVSKRLTWARARFCEGFWECFFRFGSEEFAWAAIFKAFTDFSKIISWKNWYD